MARSGRDHKAIRPFDPRREVCYQKHVPKGHFLERAFTYSELRKITGLSKKEADGWVSRGIIRAKFADDGRRRIYNYDSLMDGNIAKQIADFASRELLEHMMKGFHKFIDKERIDLRLVEPLGKRFLVQLYTRRSMEIMSGGGVRGVIPYVSRFNPFRINVVQKGVFLVVDLTEMALEVRHGIARL